VVLRRAITRKWTELERDYTMPSPVSKTGGEALRVGGQLARCVFQNIREGRAEVHLGGLVGSKIDLPHSPHPVCR
jgi:hypothetical protein